MNAAASGKKPLLTIAAIVIIALCGINLIRQMSGGGRKGFAPTGVQEYVGYALGEAAATQLGQAGNVVILAIDDSASSYPYAKKQAEAAQKALKSNGVTVQETVWLRANQILPEMGVMTVDVYMEAMAPFKGLDGIVSLAGIPAPDPMNARRDFGALQEMPPLFCVTQDRQALAPMMQGGLVKVAVCEKGTAVDMTDGKAPKKAEDWFAATYEVITSAAPPAGD